MSEESKPKSNFPGAWFFRREGLNGFCMYCVMEKQKAAFSEAINNKSAFFLDDGASWEKYPGCHVNDHKPPTPWKYHNTSVSRHMTRDHDVTFPPEWSYKDPFETWPVHVQEFFRYCKATGKKNGWNDHGVSVYKDKHRVKPPSCSQQVSLLHNLNFLERMAANLAATYQSFRACESVWLRSLLPEKEAKSLTRQNLKIAAVGFVSKQMRIFLESKRGSVAHLTADIGTIWHRYVGVCIHFGSECLLMRLVMDEAIVGENWRTPGSIFGEPPRVRKLSPPMQTTSSQAIGTKRGRDDVVDLNSSDSDQQEDTIDGSGEHNPILVADVSSDDEDTPPESTSRIVQVPLVDPFNSVEVEDEDDLLLSERFMGPPTQTQTQATSEPPLKGKVCLTGKSMQKFLIEHCDYLHFLGIVVGSVTTDNGSNMVAMGKGLTYNAGTVFALRCACHVTQLIVKAILVDENLYKNEWAALVTFMKEVNAQTHPLYVIKNYSRVPLTFKTLQATRWNSSLLLVKEIIAAIQSKDAKDVFGTVLTRCQASLSKVIQLEKQLEIFMRATRLCEANDSDMLKLLEALTILWPTLADLRNSGSVEFREVLSKHVDRFVSEGLLVTAHFMPVYNMVDVVTDSDSERLFRSLSLRITRWMTSDIAQSAAKMRPEGTERFDTSTRMFGCPKDTSEVTRSTAISEWKKRGTLFHDRLLFFVNMRPSEAEAERLFRKVKLTATKERESLAPPTVETLMHVNYFASKFEEVQVQEPTPAVLVDLPISKEVVLDILSRGMQKFCVHKDPGVLCFICGGNTLNMPLVQCVICGRRAHNRCANLFANEEANSWICGDPSC